MMNPFTHPLGLLNPSNPSSPIHKPDLKMSDNKKDKKEFDEEILDRLKKADKEGKPLPELLSDYYKGINKKFKEWKKNNEKNK